ncbi:MAG: NAD(P)/FAD-dependent oxidoreductase [Candidatus Cloacimonetes bacterium]|nr:NAD(P)/FAD-dependent oxidoreductase [Candidatus Cloacimonadota bacterium]
MENYDVIVIGGGAAGMMAAGTAAKNGKRVILIEKNPVLGKKLLITGKGRCNITNYCDVRELIENVPVNSKFLTNTFYGFNSYDTVIFFNDNGLETKVERGNRVFPTSDKAMDVVEVLMKYNYHNKVNVIHNPVVDVMQFGKIFAVKLENNEVIKADKLIIATGGKSYPSTGSTGEGYKFARNFGHKITKFKPSLVPIIAKGIFPLKDVHNSKGSNVKDLQGLSLKNTAIKIVDTKNKTVYDDFGEMLFTHFGVSGPMILSATSHIRDLDGHRLVIDLKPALTVEKLDERLQRDFKEFSNKQYKNILKNLLPKKMIPIIQMLSGIYEGKPVHQITSKDRKNLITALKELTIQLIKFRPISDAIITSGGVDVSQINPKTMESKLVTGLFFAGEVLDCDAYTGGFNLQIAWSTGYAAGMSC